MNKTAFIKLLLYSGNTFKPDYSLYALQTLNPDMPNYNPAASIVFKKAGYGTTLQHPVIKNKGKWFLTYTEAEEISNYSFPYFYFKVDVLDDDGIVTPDTTVLYEFTSFNELRYFTSLTEIKCKTTLNNTGIFQKCTKLTSVTLPNTIKRIGGTNFINSSNTNGTFAGCYNLETINLPYGLLTIDNGCFADCTKLNISSIPNSVIKISAGAFYKCKYLTITSLPPNLINLETQYQNFGTFYGCTNLALTSLPENWTYIPNGSFYQCKHLNIDSLPSGLSKIDIYAFYESNISLNSLPNGLKTIGASAFCRCNRIKIDKLPDNCKIQDSYVNGAFDSTSITINKVPEGNTAITSIFYNCKGITNIELPSTITNLGSYDGVNYHGAFKQCINLKTIIIKATTPPTINQEVVNVWSSPVSAVHIDNIYVPAESVEVYKTATYWSQLANIISAIPTT